MRESLAAVGVESEERTGRVVALPVDASGVGAVVRLARERGWVVTPSWMETGALPAGAVWLSTERLDAVAEVTPADLMAVVGAGVTVGALEDALRGHSMFWPVADEASPGETVGDTLARAPGSRTRRGNLVRKYTLGLEAVLADGEIVRTGSRTVKCVTGYDLRQLFVGSRGVLGVVVSAVLRLEAAPRREALRETYRVDFAGLSAVSGAVVTGPDGAAGEIGALDILRRLKAELDPDGVFPPAEAAFERGE